MKIEVPLQGEQPSSVASQQDMRIAGWLFAALACFFLLLAPGHFTVSDDWQKYNALESMLWRGTVFFEGGWVPGVGGSCTFYPIGCSFLMLPGALAGWAVAAWVPGIPPDYVARFFISFQNSVITAALLALIFWFSRRLGLGLRASVLGVFALAFGTMIGPYAKTSWSEPACALLLFGALVLLWRVAGDMRPSVGVSLAAGACLALACLMRLEYVLLVPGALLWLGWRLRHQMGDFWRTIAWLAAPMVLMLVITIAYDMARFGSPLVLSNWYTVQNVLERPHGRLVWALGNLWHYTLNPGDGPFWYSPALVLGFLGWWRLRRLQPVLTALLGLTLGPLFVFYFAGWGLSDWAWGQRYSYVFQPFVMLGACALTWQGAPRVWLQGGILAAGVVVQVIAWPHNFGYLYERERARHPGLSIQALMATPAHAPLLLAVREWRQTVHGGWALLQAPAPQAMPDVLSLRRQSQFVPDFWPFLLLMTPLPRWAIGLTALLAALGALGASRALWRAIHRVG